MCQKALTHIVLIFEWLGSNMAPVRNIKNIKWPIINFLCYLYKGTYKNFLISSYEDNRLLQLEAVII